MSEKQNYSNKKSQKFIFVILGGALGIVLLIFGGRLSDKGSDAREETDTSVSYDAAAAYAAMLEERIEGICSGVKGAGNVQVFVSLKGGYRTVYAVDAQSSGSGYRSEIVMSGSGSDKRAVVTAYENPEIAGVGIICDGADSAYVRAEMISLVAAALDISTNKIFVARSG